MRLVIPRKAIEFTTHDDKDNFVIETLAEPLPTSVADALKFICNEQKFTEAETQDAFESITNIAHMKAMKTWIKY